MPFESDRNVEIVIRVDDRDSAQKLERLEQTLENLGGAVLDELRRNSQQSTQAVQRLGQNAQRSAGGFTRLQASIVTLNQGLQLARSLFSGVTNSIGNLLSAVGEGQRIDGLTQSFEDLQASIGRIGTQSLQELRNATRGLVSDLELFEAANNAVLLGVDRGTGAFTELAAAAVTLGQATGRTATQALNDLTTGIGRQSRLILDNLGIIVDTNKAYEDYAASIGVATNALTEQQQTLAFQAAVLDSVNAKVAELGEIQENAGTAALRAEAAFSNLRKEFLQGLSSSTELGSAIGELADALRDVDAQQLAEDIGRLATAFVNFARIVIEQGAAALNVFLESAQATADFVTDIISGFDFGSSAELRLEIQGIEQAERDVNAARQAFDRLNSIDFDNVRGEFQLTTESILIARRAVNQLQEAAINGNLGDTLGQEVTRVRQRLQELIKEANAAQIPVRGVGQAAEEGAEGLKELEAAQKSATSAVDGFVKAQLAAADNPLLPAIRDLVQESLAGGTAVTELKDALQEQLKVLGDTPANALLVQDAFRRLTEEFNEAGKASEDFRQELAQSNQAIADFARDAVGAVDPIAEQISEAFRAIAEGAPEALEGLSIEDLINIDVTGDLSSFGDAFRSQIQAIREEFLAGGGTIDEFNAALRRASPIINKFKTDTAAAKKEISDFRDALKESFDPSTARTARQFSTELLQLRNRLEGGAISFDEFAASAEELRQKFGLSAQEAQRLAQALDAFEGNNPFAAAIGGLEDLTDLLGGAAGNLGDLLGLDLSGIGGGLGDLFDDITGAIDTSGLGDFLGTELGQGISSSIVSSIEAAIRGGDIQALFGELAQDIGGQLGASVGSAFGPVGALIGEQLGDAIGEQIGEIGTSTRDTLQGIGGLLFGPTGFAIGDAIGNLFGGREDPFRDARIGLRDFLAEAEEAAGTDFFGDFRIEGFSEVVKSLEEVQQIFGDTFEDFTTELEDGSFLVNEFSAELGELGLTANRELLGTFEGIGTAIASIFEDSEGSIAAFGQQFGTLLGVNLIDELGLNELQLVLEQAGFSAESFSAALEQAFFTGELSAGQFLNASQSAADLFEQGIPGAVGAVDAAFANLVSGGLSSGQQALDALGDIGAEALDLNVQSTEELGNALVKAGVDAESVTQLLQALTNAGITTTEALANVDLTQAAQIIANLESIGFGFQEVSDEITTARDLLDQFRREASNPIRTRIVVDVEVNDPEDGLGALEREGGPSLARLSGQNINS